MVSPRVFNPKCSRCPRLATFLETVRHQHPDYYARPVPPFGDPDPKLLIVGLAPGLHGANATGRPFTGDFAGILLYRMLHDYGFGSRAVSRSVHDGLTLRGCRITNAVKCVPPQNAPLTDEVKRCNEYLHNEIGGLKPGTVILALGLVAHQAVLMALGLKRSAYPFKHGAEYPLIQGLHLIDSYHSSRYNVQTRRLTEPMFKAIFDQIETRIRAAGA